MAEMTAKQAIAVLHNNQYQKHIANGEYDYIHPLTDAECKGIESLIQQQQQQIERLKCCGNCINWRNGNIMQCMLTYKVIGHKGKCDEWQAMEGQ